MISMLAIHHATHADAIRKYPANIRSQSVPVSSATAASVEPIASKASSVVVPFFSLEATVMPQVIAAATMNQKPSSGKAPLGRTTLPLAYNSSRIPYAVQKAPQVPCIAIAGLAIALVLIPDRATWISVYGSLLLAKIAAFLVLMVLAAWNRWRAVPALAAASHSSTAGDGLRRMIAIEYLLIVAVLATTATLTIRVPAARFDEARTEIRKLGTKIETDKIDAQDVTQQYVDQDATIRNLKAEEAQLRASEEQAAANRDRIPVLKASGAIAEQDALQYETQAKTTQALLDSNQLRLKYTRVLAPDDGAISSRTATFSKAPRTS